MPELTLFIPDMKCFTGWLVAWAIALFSCAPDHVHDATTRLDALCTARDTASWIAYVDSSHAGARSYLELRLRQFQDAHRNDSVGTDVLRQDLEWLLHSYTIHTARKDLSLQLSFLESLEPAQREAKARLDSLLGDGLNRYARLAPEDRAAGAQAWLDRLRELERDYLAMGDSDRLAALMLQQGRVQADLARYPEALKSLASCRDLCDRYGLVERWANAALVEARLLSVQLADYYAAERLLAQAAGAYESVGQFPRVAYIDVQRGYVFQQLNQPTRAIEFFTRARPVFRDLNRPSDEAYCLNMIAECYFDLDVLDSAALYSQRALRLRETLLDQRETTQGHIDVGHALSTYALILQSTGDLRGARRGYERAEAHFASSGSTIDICLNAGREANLLTSTSAFAEARELYEYIIEHSPKYESQIQSLFGLAVCDYYLGDSEQATRRLRACITQHERTREQLPLPELRTGAFADKLGYYKLLVAMLLKDYLDTERPSALDSAFMLLERSRAATLVDELASDRTTTVSEREDSLLLRIAQLERSAARLEVDSASLQRRITRLEDSLYLVRLADTLSAPLLLPSFAGALSGISEVQEHLPEDAAVVAYALSDFGSYVVTITSDTCNVTELALHRDSVLRLVEEYVRHISAYPTVDDFRGETYQAGARRLYEILWSPVMGSAGSPERLLVVGTEDLHALPAGALMDERGVYLAETAVITYAPSVATWQRVRERAAQTTYGENVVAFGDPTFDTLSDLAPLPGTRAELNAIRDLFGAAHSVTFEASAATETRFKATDFSAARYVHLASHGLCNVTHPSQSAIAFSFEEQASESGFLHPFEVAQLKFQTELVFLSACRSASGRAVPGEGVMNLTRPFLIAGCNGAIATLWGVDDRCTAHLVGDFYGRVKEGASPAVALTGSQRELISSERPLYRHPYFWAAFVATAVD